MRFHIFRDPAHGLIAGEEHECAGRAFVCEVGDPFFQGLFVAGVFGFGHLAHEMQGHLLFVIERASNLQRRDILGTHAMAEIGKIGGSDRERRAG